MLLVCFVQNLMLKTWRTFFQVLCIVVLKLPKYAFKQFSSNFL